MLINNITNKNPIHFGARGMSDYTIHHDKKRRENYIKRHSKNEDYNGINAGSLSRFILWGDSTDIKKNIKDYEKRFNI